MTNGIHIKQLVEIYDTETKRTIRGAEALAELLKDPYDTED